MLVKFMKGRNPMPTIVALMVVSGVLCWLGYMTIYRPYFQTPGEDIEFLNRADTKSEIIRRFDRGDEELMPGERFQMSGWHPLPDRSVTGSAFSVVRRNGWKIYLFFDPNGMLEEYFIAHS